MIWHRMTIDDVLAAVGSSAEGLGSAEAARRLEIHGRNELVEKKKRHVLRMVAAQFSDFLILTLLAAAVLAGLIGDPGDAVPIVVIVLINAAIGFVQEYRAAAAMAQLKKMAGHTAVVVREGRTETVPVTEVVPGDLVLFESGSIVPADLRLVEAAQLRVEESALTGESLPVEKITDQLDDDEIPLGDRINVAFKGTVVVAGRGRGIVVATGMATELGRIALLLEETEETATPLQRRLTRFGRNLATSILVFCGLLFLAGYLHGQPPLLMFLTAVSLAVAAIPEALPAVVTISLALGARKMARRKALVKKLPAVETLGSVSHICTDKTGTLTMNRMTVTRIWPEDLIDRHDERRRLFLLALALCNDVTAAGGGALMGDPTEVALCRFAIENGIDIEQLKRDYPRVAEIPFDAERRRMTTFHPDQEGAMVLTKGGVEKVLPLCVLPCSRTGGQDPETIVAAAEGLSAGGLRVLAVAAGRMPRGAEEYLGTEQERDLVFLGLVAMMDPPRPEAREAVARCRRAGIVPVMITGDHPATASAIATELGILSGDAGVITGVELAHMPAEELAARSGAIAVYARVAPEQKLKIVRALQSLGHRVAMTGDGVNDAPALKAADIGVAMGQAGTDVAREAAAMVLLDDNFSTIVNAVEEGRRIYSNILRFVVYTVTSNAGTLCAIVLAPFFGLPLPLLPLQILWLNMLCDSLPGLALAAEPPGQGTMSRPPVAPEEGIFAGGRGWFVAAYGILIGTVALVLEAWAINAGHPWQTMVFTYLVLNRMSVVLAVRSFRIPLFKVGLLANLPLVAAIGLTFLLQMAAVYTPAGNRIFATSPLSAVEVGIALLLSGGLILVHEAVKMTRAGLRWWTTSR